MEQQFDLEKWVWTNDDFPKMGWHDCPIYAMSFNDDIRLDIDYIFEWIHNGPGKPFTFWIAPATLIFESAGYFQVDVESDFVNGLEIAAIIREERPDETIWTIATQEGDIIIKADNYRQVIRRAPSFQYSQFVPTEERGEVSFSETIEVNYSDSAEVIAKRKERALLYKLKSDKSDLLAKQEALDETVLGTKAYLTEKRQIDQAIFEIEQAIAQLSV